MAKIICLMSYILKDFISIGEKVNKNPRDIVKVQKKWSLMKKKQHKPIVSKLNSNKKIPNILIKNSM